MIQFHTKILDFDFQKFVIQELILSALYPKRDYLILSNVLFWITDHHQFMDSEFWIINQDYS